MAKFPLRLLGLLLLTVALSAASCSALLHSFSRPVSPAAVEHGIGVDR